VAGKRSLLEGDLLSHRIDFLRIGLAGHSSGGAVAFEAVARSQKGSFPAKAVCLLDAVPWESTLHMARRFKPMPVCSLRSDPSPLNLLGLVHRLLERLSFPVEDIRIQGASHSDPENPTSTFVQMMAGLSRPEYQALYQKLMYLFFVDAFGSSRRIRYCHPIGTPSRSSLGTGVLSSNLFRDDAKGQTKAVLLTVFDLCRRCWEGGEGNRFRQRMANSYSQSDRKELALPGYSRLLFYLVLTVLVIRISHAT